MKVKFKKLNPSAVIPSQSNPNDAGFDLTALSITHPAGSTGMYVEVCHGYSSRNTKKLCRLNISALKHLKHKAFLKKLCWR